jgi:TonB family protein
MMSAFANSVQKPERFDLYVRKFQSICMMHGIQVGSRKELPDFLRKLVDDRHLAMDFWAFVSKLSDREGGELSDDQVLGVVVEGLTDAEISEVDGGAKRTVDGLRAMLSGVDIQNPEQIQVEMAPFPRSGGGSQRDERQVWTHAEELATPPSNPQATFTPQKQAPPRSEQEAAWASEKPVPLASEKQVPLAPEKQVPIASETQVPIASETQVPITSQKQPFFPAEKDVSFTSERPVTVSAAAPPPQLDETLLRLELTRLVQQYFDNIDKRISKLEPNPDGPGIIAPAVTRRSLEEPTSAQEMEELRLRRMGRTRIVLESPRSPAEAPGRAAKDDEDIPMSIPLEHYSPPERFGKAPLLLVLVLVGAAVAIYRDPTLLRRGIAAVVRQLHTDHPMASSNQSATPPASSEDRTSVQSEQGAPSPLQSALEGTSAPPPANPPEQKSSSAGPETGGNETDATSSRKTTTDRAIAQTEQAISDGISSAEAAGAVLVNPSVMDENLVVQRVPAYPEVAKMSGVEGDVVMQALISKEGTVKRVHVTEGDSRLRSAAEEAVYKWRYRPYVLHGRPVEVATTVTVNFNLDRR